MRTFIVYNLDTRLPVTVGEAISAERARIETANTTKLRAENLIAKEIAVQLSGLQGASFFPLKKVWNKSRGNR